MNRLIQLLFLAAVSFIVICTVPGCYTYDPMSKDELIDGYPKPEHSVRITLRDGSVIDSPEYLHILTNERSDVIIGIAHDRSAKSAVFRGIVKTNALDSVKKIPTSDGVFLVCWSKNKTSLAFKEGQYLLLTSQDGLGFWCAGRRTTPAGTTDFKGMLTRDQFRSLEVRNLDYATIAYIIAPVAVVLLALEAVRGSRPGAFK